MARVQKAFGEAKVLARKKTVPFIVMTGALWGAGAMAPAAQAATLLKHAANGTPIMMDFKRDFSKSPFDASHRHMVVYSSQWNDPVLTLDMNFYNPKNGWHPAGLTIDTQAKTAILNMHEAPPGTKAEIKLKGVHLDKQTGVLSIPAKEKRRLRAFGAGYDSWIEMKSAALIGYKQSVSQASVSEASNQRLASLSSSGKTENRVVTTSPHEPSQTITKAPASDVVSSKEVASTHASDELALRAKIDELNEKLVQEKQRRESAKVVGTFNRNQLTEAKEYLEKELQEVRSRQWSYAAGGVFGGITLMALLWAGLELASLLKNNGNKNPNDPGNPGGPGNGVSGNMGQAEGRRQETPVKSRALVPVNYVAKVEMRKPLQPDGWKVALAAAGTGVVAGLLARPLLRRFPKGKPLSYEFV